MLHTEEYKILLPKEVPEPEKTPFILAVGPAMTMIVPILLMALLASNFYGQNSSGYMYLSLITGGTGCLFGVIWIIVNRSFKNRSYKKKLEAKKREYELYISQTDDYLNNCAGENREYLLKHYPSAKELTESLNEYSVWKRYKADEDFGFVRIGIGTIPFHMKVSVDSPIKEMFPSKETLIAKELVDKYQYISDVPVGVDFLLHKYINVVPTGMETVDYEYILGLLVKISASIHHKDISLAIFYDESNEIQRKLVQSVKFLPHLFDTVTGRRYLFGSPESIRKLLPDFDSDESDKTEPVIAFILDDKYIKEEIIYQKMTGNVGAGKLSTVFLKTEIKMPSCIQKVIRIKAEHLDERISFKEADYYSRTLAGYINDINSNSEKLPSKVDILNLYNADTINDIPIWKMWSENDPCKRIKVPIGVLQNKEKIYLDVHEKFHGPHGLIAGTTGSGKSELIQSYLISLCLSFSPEDVNFFLIDYKGGGTGNHISKLKHCVGCISNLSGNRINRSLLAIASENRRRQELFSFYGVNHIDDYMRLYRSGIAKEVMPHLLLIIDEFAELKKEEPDFMKQIISLAAVGRSLGIHLILATQKPAGVVDDKIRANSNFKLCLKVQDRQDSMDMLGRKEAAYLTNPGDCYLQIGNNEFFQKFKAAYCGGKYIEGTKIREVSLIDETGDKMNVSRVALNQNSRLLIDVLVEYINNYAKEKEIIGSESLWMEELKEEIPFKLTRENKALKDVEDVDDEDVDEEIIDMNSLSSYVNHKRFLFGLYDNPIERKQGYAAYDPLVDGNLIIGGNSGSGKTQLLSVLAYEASMFGTVILIDITNEKLFEVTNIDKAMGLIRNVEDVDIFFYHLRRLLANRKEESIPIFIFIDNLPSLIKCLDDEKLELLYTLLSVGLSKRICVIASITTPGELSPKYFSKFKSSLSFEMNDKFQYGDMLRDYRIGVEIRKNTPGRCLYRIDETICECQVFSSIDSSFETKNNRGCQTDESDITDVLDVLEVFEIPSIPEKVTIEQLLTAATSFCNRSKSRNSDSDNKDYYKESFIPLGYSLKSGYVRGINMNNSSTFVISTDREKQLFEYMNTIEMTLLSLHSDADGNIYGIISRDIVSNTFRFTTDEDISLYTEMKGNASTEVDVLFIDNLSILIGHEESDLYKHMLNIAEKREAGFVFVGVLNEVSFDISSMKLYRALVKNNQGICIGGMLSNQRNIDFNDIGYAESSLMIPNGVGYMRLEGVEKTIKMKLPVGIKEEEIDDYD